MCLIIFTADNTQPIVDALRDAGMLKGAIITLNPETPRDSPILVATLPRAANIINPPDGLDTHNAAVWLWDGVKLSRRIKTTADARIFLATADACDPCQDIGASCGGTSGKNCADTLAAHSILAADYWAQPQEVRVAQMRAYHAERRAALP